MSPSIERHTMTDNLPPLPVPYGQGFTDEQMRNYANAAIDAALAARGAVPAGWREAMTNLLWAATERDKKNRIRQFDEFVDAARELLATAPQQVAQQWQPIETAPKDSKARLVWCPDRKNCYLVSWDGRYEGEWVLFAAGNIGLSEEPTHWMPIPTAPQKPKD